MPSKSNKKIKPVDAKAIDIFVERLAEILLMQIEQKEIGRPKKKTK